MKQKWGGGGTEKQRRGVLNGEEVIIKMGDKRRGCPDGIYFIPLEQPLNYILKRWTFYRPNLSISATKVFTALTELSNRAFSSLLSVSSIIFSTPSEPRTAGTPT
jgi:hypothetical protein